MKYTIKNFRSDFPDDKTYLDEFSFRYNHRGEALPVLMFAKVGTLLPKVGKTGS